MKLFSHFAVIGFSNTYIVGPDKGGDAILVDPGVMDLESLKLIEGNNFYVRHILVTTPHESHVQGLKTTLKIYEAEVYSGLTMIGDFPCTQVHDGEQLKLAGFEVSVLNVSGHSKDSMVYRVEDVLFTGDALGAGRLGDSPNAYARAILKSTILEKISGLDDHLLVFPGHGPPSTLAAEKMFNPAFIENTQS
jgi:glyoxylase-like metal-dependent hydrolase (beta-lactamase superfamily II)